MEVNSFKYFLVMSFFNSLRYFMGLFCQCTHELNDNVYI